MSRATMRKPRANRQSNSTSNATVSTQQSTTLTEVSQLSNAALLTMGWFQVTGAGDGENERDVAFRQALINELVERGVLNKPELTYDSINVASLTEDNLDSFATMFQEPGEPTLEDSFVKAVTGIDRFKERSVEPKPCGECENLNEYIHQAERSEERRV